MSMTMLTALVYAVSQRQSKIDAAELNKAREEGYKSGVSRTNADYYEKQYKELDEKVHAFEKASGLTIQYGWSKPEKVGAIVKLLLDGQAPLKRILDTAKYNLTKTDDLKTEIEKQIKVLESALANQPVEDSEADDE
jgi:hypothetical protein